ncbi:glycerol-3-phosphate 1-O-acyltransferase PlsY [Paenibacillus chitinolyticus]
MIYIIPAVAAYLLGSLSFSFIIGKLVKGIDIRSHGSGNAGATNTLRVLGKGPAVLVLVLDVVKAILAVWIGKWMAPDQIWVHVACGLAVIIGHNWPVFFGFRGGKGVATAIGVTATLCFLPAIFAGVIAIASIFLTRYVSLGSLLFTALLPFFVWGMGRPVEILWGVIVIGVFTFWRHRTNISKLVQGRENKIGSKKA